MSGAAVQALALTALALVLFAWNRLRVEVVALIIMTLLILSGLVTPQEGISGFAHEATATVALMLVLAAGLLRTGVVDLLARWVVAAARGSELRLLLLVVGLVVPLSAFINNTAAVAVMLPMILGVARSSGSAPSRVLMPLSFAAQLGGTLTLIGTSTNLLVAGLVLSLGAPRISLFDVTAPAAVICLAGVLYLLTVGRWLLPHREPDTDLLRSYELHDYLTVLRVLPGSRIADRTLASTRFGEKHGLQVVRVERGDGRILAASGSTLVHEGDLLLVQGKIADIAKIESESGLELADRELVFGDVAQENLRVAELLVPRRSTAARRSVRELELRARFGVSVMAVRRHGVALHEPVGSVRLRPGDMLLVQGTPEALTRMHGESELMLLGAVDLPLIRQQKMRIAVPVMVAVVLLPALGIAPIMVSALMGVVVMLLTGCITPDEAYREMDWMVIVLLGAILPLGQAMHTSGAAAVLAQGLLQVAQPLGNHGVLAALLLLTTALTSVISNAAAAAVLAPMAIAIAASMGLSPMPFILAVMIGASNSFISPIGYQTNAMVFGPGGYRFADYVRVGTPLALVVAGVGTFVIPWFFPF